MSGSWVDRTKMKKGGKIMKRNEEKKYVISKNDSDGAFGDTSLKIACPNRDNPNETDLIIESSASPAPETFHQLFRFLYKNYSGTFWQYVEEIKKRNNKNYAAYFDEDFNDFLFDIISDSFDESFCDFDLLEMPEYVYEDTTSIDRDSIFDDPLVIDVTLKSLNDLGHLDKMKEYIQWIEQKTGICIEIRVIYTRVLK